MAFGKVFPKTGHRTRRVWKGIFKDESPGAQERSRSFGKEFPKRRLRDLLLWKGLSKDPRPAEVGAPHVSFMCHSISRRYVRNSCSLRAFRFARSTSLYRPGGKRVRFRRDRLISSILTRSAGNV